MSASVFPHPDFESLIAALPAGGRPGKPVLQPVVVPSLLFADCVQRRMADRFGISMGMDFQMPRDFVHQAVGPGRNSPWSKRRLVWRILPHVSAYCNLLGLQDPSPRDRFALAGVIADRFDQYGHFRPELIRQWALGQWGGDKEAEHEAWQRGLWEKLQDGIDSPHPALAMENLRMDCDARKTLAGHYPELLVLGTGALDPLLIEVLQLLSSEGSQVKVHVVLPSMDFLGDLRRRGEIPGTNMDPEDIAIMGGHPLLESMGRHAIGAFHLLGKLDDQYTHWPEADAGPSGEGALLHRLQSDVRSIRGPSGGKMVPGDISLRVHSCFGPRREMEVLRDELLRAFDEIENLQPGEVHIVTPDLETYAPLVAAVLRQGKSPLPVQLSELPASDGDPAAEGMLALLGMANTRRFEASEILDLAGKPAVLAAFGIEDPSVLHRWIRDSGLTHGLGINGPGTAGFSRQRLVAGRWFEPDAAVRYPDGMFVLPVSDHLGGDTGLGERFFAWLAGIEAMVDEWKVPASPGVWAKRLSAAARDLLEVPEEDSLALGELISFLAEQDCEGELDAGAVLDWMQAECAEGGRRARHSGGIAFGRFKQLQNLPCRVLAMVGMQDVQFPARNRHPAWDLLKANPCIWDRSPRNDDRQLFLDALLTPAERLIITAGTRNVRTMDSEPFSSCVDELLRVVAAMGGGRPVVEQKLQPFASGYFCEEGGLPRSYDGFHAEVASQIQAAGNQPGEPFWEKVAAIPDCGLEITSGRLAAFWKDPAAAFVKACGIFLSRGEEADEDLNRSPVDLDGLQQWKLNEGILNDIIAGMDQPGLLRARMAAGRQLPPGELAAFSWNRAHALMQPLGSSVKAQIGEKLSLEYAAGPDLHVTAEVFLTKDRAAILAFSPAHAKEPRHFLPAWIAALVAAAAGHGFPTHFFDPVHSEAPLILDPIGLDPAGETLAALIEYCKEGQARPLRFAPVTSDVLIKKLSGKDCDEAMAVSEAEKEWSKEDTGFGCGEGRKEAARLAWRDQNPFEEPAGWLELARVVSQPLRQWALSK